MRDVILEKRCARCGSQFTTPWPRQMYCSDRCKAGVKACEQCGKEFAALTKNTSGRFCTKACWYAYYAEHGKATKTCPVCEATFHGEAATCSKACGYALRRSSHPERRTTCERCGEALPSNVKPGQRFCSRACSLQTMNRRGQRVRPEGFKRPTPQGYVQMKVGNRWRFEHHVVMEEIEGRTLYPEERVHHKNGVRDDNDPGNLELWLVLSKDPAGQRVDDLIDYIVTHYPDKVRARL